ncbi:hypothetical protein BRD17_00720 [Halobacteriales archaeon SW_7_68_16]|nr:MAG: hypothetical protein BRD17_00720 [Halobacteriales archaeon SW_7_68_16]
MTTVSSTYRILGYDGEQARQLLFDIENEAPVWVRNGASTAAVQQVLDDTIPGNVIGASVEGDPSSDDPWEYRDVQIVDRTTLDFVDGTNYCPGPAEETWRERDDNVGITVFEDDQTGQPQVELQVHPKEHDGQQVWDDIRVGRIPIEPWFRPQNTEQGESLSVLPQGAHHLIVQNPPDHPFLIFHSFPEGSAQFFQEYRTDLIEHVRAPTQTR